MPEAPFREKLSRLVRTNIALIALCTISIGVLLIYFTRSQAPAAAGPAIRKDVPGASNFQSSLKDLPPPSEYASFIYKPGMAFSVGGECRADYWAVMIFPSDKDYRVEPTAAVYNTADPSPANHTCSRTIDLSRLNLTASSSYYVIKADEGKTGGWYNPR